MEVASIERLPEGSDATVRIYHCRACHHEMHLTVWASITEDGLIPTYRSA
jgi:hypothetical protein